ncbi:response regulator [Flavobacterium sp.]|uniref:response regulator n=1 Tax=Flavobacterium sp. TaxID=239 RepID=UPI0037535BD1
MGKTLTILLIEDDVIEVMKFNRVINSLAIKHKLVEANNGEEALSILKMKGVTPDIILLDLNMPKLNGIEFLRILKNDDFLKHIPSVVFTTSNNPNDILECFRIGIAGYIIKPLKYEDYFVRIKQTLDYWCGNELIYS